jgi:hypothetical protein
MLEEEEEEEEEEVREEQQQKQVPTERPLHPRTLALQRSKSKSVLCVRRRRSHVRADYETFSKSRS